MEKQAHLFIDDTLNGISLSIQNLQHQETEAKASNPDVHHVITKYNPHFRNLINFLDLSFSFGLKDAKKGYWPFVKKIAHSSVIEMVETHKLAISEVKKGYIWLFLTFIENSLEGYIRMMVSNVKLLKIFYKEYALLRDTERREILLNLLVGIETFSFSINFDEPYLDFGHDPVLRQEKIIIRVQPPFLCMKTSIDTERQQLQQPDVTIHPPVIKKCTYPDLLEAQRNFFTKTPEGSPLRHSVSMDSNEIDVDLVRHVSKRRHKKKRGRTVSEGDVSDVNAPEEESLELEEDNFIPEFVGSPEYALCITEEPNSVMDTSDPVLQSLSETDIGYQQFLECYAKEDRIIEEPMGNELDREVEINIEISKDDVSATNAEDHSCEADDLTPTEPVENKIKKLSLGELDGYCFTHVSDDERNVYDDEDNSNWIGRSDSFDKFCKKELSMSSSLEETSPLSKTDSSISLVEINPKVPHVFASPQLSKTSADRINDARHDTETGFLLPSLPRRPDLKEAMLRTEEIILDQSAEILLSLEIFSHPTELPVKMFEVSVGILVGLNCTYYLLVSTHTLYILKQKDTIQCRYASIISVDIDSINKVQTGLNFQEVYIVHDNGCFHVSTADEVSTRSILLTIKSVIKSTKEEDLTTEQPMAANTNNDLDLIIQDWLICHTAVEDPHIYHFALIQFSVLSPHDRKNKVMKAGYVSCRQYILGVRKPWEKAFFALRGHILYQYSSHGNEIKNTYDISTKCGGCVHSGNDGSRYMFKILGVDGSTTLVEVGVDNENEANEWLLTICQVVADTKNEPEGIQSVPGLLVSCGLVLTDDTIYFFNQDPKSGRLSLEESCAVADITQVCIDNENRTYCTVVLDYYVDHSSQDEKIYWLLNFKSEYELGKFEEQLCDCWQSLYQVPLQFVLLSDTSLKQKIEPVLHTRQPRNGDIDRKLLMEIITN